MNKTAFKLKIFLIVLLAIGFVINGVFITLYNVDKSVNIGTVSKEMNNLMSENDRLVEKIATGDSLTDFLKRSETAGYGTNIKILYFNQAGSVAQAR